ncbi:MAG TPA: SRPBCC family protein [Candidatus Binatia bacterium]|nr:SRPBCC family protein [Candidatus Binatia bacterium]
MSARNIAIAVVVLVLLALGYFYVKFRGVQQQAVKWEGPVPEITSENIQKDGDVTKVEMSSRIDAPVDAVFATFLTPEKAEGRVPEIKKATVVSGDDKKKQVEFHITTLGQLQVFTVDLTYDKPGSTVGIKTVEGAIDIDGKYKLTPSPDGKRTLVQYTATQRNKLPLPVPQDVERSAIKEQFANLMKAIKKTLADEGKIVSWLESPLRAAA